MWSLLDRDHPLTGGTVSVYAGVPRRGGTQWLAPGPQLRPKLPLHPARTNAAGVAVLEFSLLPAQFTVVVRGARVKGQRLPGTLRAVVRGYRSGSVVYVNAVTTLVSEVLATKGAVPGGGALIAARRQVYRALSIPSWVDDADLSWSDRLFDGRRYLIAARRAGGTAVLDRRIVRAALSGSSAGFLTGGPSTSPRFTAGPEAPVASAAAGTDWLALLKGDRRALFKAAFKELALQAGKSLASFALGKAGGAALGWLMAAFGFEQELGDPEIMAIRQALEALGRQLTQLQGEVALAGFTALFHQTDRTIGQIDHASSQLALLANMPDTDPTKRAFTQTIVDYIGDHLIDAPQILDRGLGSKLPVADNLIKSASRATAQRHRFFDAQSSAEVEGVYDYFATYQVQLAMLLQEYYHARPAIYSPANAQANLATIERNVEGQAASLKPVVPADTVVDTKTREMWVQTLPKPEVNLAVIVELYDAYLGGKRVTKFRLTPAAGPTSLAGFPFANWEVPSMRAYEQLVAGWTGASPIKWLEQEGRFRPSLLTAHSGYQWVRDGFSLPCCTFLATPVQFYRFSLASAGPDGPTRREFLHNYKQLFDKLRAGLMYVRKLAADETYWWSG